MDGRTSPIHVPSSKVTLVGVKVTKINLPVVLVDDSVVSRCHLKQTLATRESRAERSWKAVPCLREAGIVNIEHLVLTLLLHSPGIHLYPLPPC